MCEYPPQSFPSMNSPVSSRHDFIATFASGFKPRHRSGEHTSELQSQSNLVCRLLLDKNKYARLNDSTWRKNRRANGDGTFGVDLNRHYGYLCGDGGFGTSTSDREHRGTGPSSPPERQ